MFTAGLGLRTFPDANVIDSSNGLGATTPDVGPVLPGSVDGWGQVSALWGWPSIPHVLSHLHCTGQLCQLFQRTMEPRGAVGTPQVIAGQRHMSAASRLVAGG